MLLTEKNILVTDNAKNKHVGITQGTGSGPFFSDLDPDQQIRILKPDPDPVPINKAVKKCSWNLRFLHTLGKFFNLKIFLFSHIFKGNVDTRDRRSCYHYLFSNEFSF